ncbi:unnamed protein product [Choristocarpus tenellus]
MSQQFVSYYDSLGVCHMATTEDIDRAYRKASLRAHPDKGGDPEVFRHLKKAHEVLRDPKLRKRYDEYGPSLSPSPGHLIGAGTVGRLVPLAISAGGCVLMQLGRTFGAFGVRGWGLGCFASAATASLLAESRGDSLPAVLGGLLMGNATGFVVGIVMCGMRSLVYRR